MNAGICSVCEKPLAGKYANALTCGSPCRQKAYRERLKSIPAVAQPPRRNWLEQPPQTPLEWQALRNAVERARLERQGGFTRVEREERRRERQAAA